MNFFCVEIVSSVNKTGMNTHMTQIENNAVNYGVGAGVYCQLITFLSDQ